MVSLRKLTLLSLLIASVGLLVSGERITNCEGDIQYLRCDTGVINVKSTVYGRTDTKTCSLNRPASQLANIQCSLAISTIANRCNGLKECEVKTSLLQTTDPCPGTSKYYKTTYNCVKGDLAVICEQGYSTLDCGADFIWIINANYGRANSRTCSNGLPASAIQNNNCYSSNARSIVSSLCNEQSTCTVEASNSVFTDTCAGTVKYLTVSYICSKQIVVCELKKALLSCGSRSIHIVWANYGRTDSTTCSSGLSAIQLSNTNCNTPDTLNIVAASCEGQNSCQVQASNDIFSDPCPFTYKYLKIVYSCV